MERLKDRPFLQGGGSPIILAAWLAFAFPAHSAEAVFSIRWITNSNPIAVEVAGVSQKTLDYLHHAHWQSEQWQKLFSVYASQGDLLTDLKVPPMLGSYRIQDSRVRFEPTFPLQRGVTYRAVFRPARLPENTGNPPDCVSSFQLPEVQPHPASVVSQIYPSSDVLPENLLKFYVHFSAPMQGGRIYDHIHLRDEAGRPVELPFLEIDEELWNSEMTRLTLFIDPGRIKRGVKPLEEIGPALETGKSYTLEIDAGWFDHAGMPLREGFRKTFRVGAADREPPSLATWKLTAPKAGTREVLKVAFPEPMDHALALRVIRVVGPAGKTVAGASALSDGERLWSFTPLQFWSAGRHQLQVQSTLEDLAGNNPGKVFEVDLFEGVQRRLTNEVLKLSFEVR